MRTIYKNASGNLFSVANTGAGWKAEQVDGVHHNYRCIPAILYADTKRQLLARLSDHESNNRVQADDLR